MITIREATLEGWVVLAQPSMIKRPVLDAKNRLTVGFKPEEYKKAFRLRSLPRTVMSGPVS